MSNGQCPKPPVGSWMFMAMCVLWGSLQYNVGTPLNKRVEEEDRSRAVFFFWHISFCHLIWKYDSDKELPYVVLCRLYITFVTYIIIYILYIYIRVFKIKEWPTSVFAFVCMWVCACPRSQTVHVGPPDISWGQYLRTSSATMLRLHHAKRSQWSHCLTDVRCSEWDGFCWRMGFYNNERLMMESFAIGASTWGLVEPPLTLRVACCNSKSRRVFEGLLPSMIRFWLQRFCMNPSQLHSWTCVSTYVPLVLLVTFPFI